MENPLTLTQEEQCFSHYDDINARIAEINCTLNEVLELTDYVNSQQDGYREYCDDYISWSDCDADIYCLNKEIKKYLGEHSPAYEHINEVEKHAKRIHQKGDNFERAFNLLKALVEDELSYCYEEKYGLEDYCMSQFPARFQKKYGLNTQHFQKNFSDKDLKTLDIPLGEADNE